MTTLGYHCSHEQYLPSVLLRHAKLAAEAGFADAMCSDHFHPWSAQQGNSGFAWSWLAAALEASSLSLGTVCAPGQRYHPAVIAQAAATLAEMYPGRFWLALGSGEALNESITGEGWASKPLRRQRLKECAEVMRSLWSGETVTHDGLVQVRNATLYSRPAQAPKLMGACLSSETAEWMGSWADGIVTVTQERETMRDIIDAFRAGGGQGKPIYLQVVVSFAASDEEASRAAHAEWRQAALSHEQLANLDSPQAFDLATRGLQPEDVAASVRISSDVRQHLDWLSQDADMGFDKLFLHNVHRDQQAFIGKFAEHVLPHFGGPR